MTCAARFTVSTSTRERDRMRDPSFPISIRRLEQHPDYREAAQACPDLAAPRAKPVPGVAHCNVILIHGGLSNGLADFGDSLIGGRHPLLKPGAGVNVFRFEHDTWLPVEDNARELVALIRRKLQGRMLLIIGFSRGGVVAARVAAKLRELGAIAPCPGRQPRGTHADVMLMTFGTPHLGFRTGDVGWHFPRVCYCLQYAVSSAIMHLPLLSRLAIFVDSLRRLSRLPPGIADIATRNAELEAFIGSAAGRWIEQRLHAYGGSPVEPKWLPSWWRTLLARPVPGIGDGAVSLDSATAYGRERKEVRGCGHDDYFGHAEIRAAIAGRLRRLGAFGAGALLASAA